MIAYKILRAVPPTQRKTTALNLVAARPDLKSSVSPILDELNAFMDGDSDAVSIQNECAKIWPDSWIACDDQHVDVTKENITISALHRFIECPELGEAEMCLKCDMFVDDDVVHIDRLRWVPKTPLYKLKEWWRHKSISTPFHLKMTQAFSPIIDGEESYSTLEIAHKENNTFVVTLESDVSQIGWYVLHSGSKSWDFTFDAASNAMDWRSTADLLLPPACDVADETFCSHGDGCLFVAYADGTTMTGLYSDNFYHYQMAICLKDIERLIL
jgi:hypothetical protein